ASAVGVGGGTAGAPAVDAIGDRDGLGALVVRDAPRDEGVVQGERAVVVLIAGNADHVRMPRGDGQLQGGAGAAAVVVAGDGIRVGGGAGGVRAQDGVKGGAVAGAEG